MQKTLSSILTGLFLAVHVAPALAATKYTKKESDIAAPQTALTKPTQKPKDDKQRPAITTEDIFGGVGEKVKGITDQQIQVLRRLIDATNDRDPEKPDLYFRMAELYAEQRRYYNFRARELDQTIFDAQVANHADQAKKLQNDQTELGKKEKQWLLLAVGEYIKVADHPELYGNYKRMDEVLFSLAYLLGEVKKEDAALRYFKRLIKDYPKSRFIPDAYFSFGEYYFDNKDLESAFKFYDKVLQFPDSRVFLYAKYKIGWCYFNLQDFKMSLQTFKEVVELSEKGIGTGTKQNKLALAKEAKKDIVRSYARVGTSDKAWPFFQRTGGDYAMTMLEQLAEIYNSQGQFVDSIKVYRQLIAIAPTSPKLCDWQSEVLKNNLSMTGSRANPDSVKEMQRLAAIYEKMKERKDLKADVLEECRDTTRGTIGELAKLWHIEGRKTKNKDTLALAQYLYKEYITKFPNEKDTYDMMFYYAELLWELGTSGDNQKYCEAAPIYSKVVEMKPDPTIPRVKEAAYAAVLAWKNCLDIEDTRESGEQERAKKLQAGKGVPVAQAFAPQPIPERQQKMIDAFETYIKFVPDSKELPTIIYREGFMYYQYNHFDKAEPLLQKIVDKHKDSELSIVSANLILDIMSIQKRYDEIEDRLDKYLATPQWQQDQTNRDYWAALKCRLLRRRIEDVEKAKQYAEAGRQIARLIERCSDAKDARTDELYYNAGIDFEKAKLIGLAIRSREELIKRFPDSPLAKKAIYLIGGSYQAIAYYEAAADKYEAFASKYPGEKEASGALYTASFFRRGLGEPDKSIADTKQFTATYGARHEFTDKAAGVNFEEGAIYEQQKDYARLQKHLLDYLKVWGARGGVDRQIIANVKLGEILWRQSCPAPNGGINGACVSVTRERAGGAAKVADKQKKKKKKNDLSPQCGPATKSKITVFPRKPALVKEAMAHFAEALRLFKGGAAEKAVPLVVEKVDDKAPDQAKAAEAAKATAEAIRGARIAAMNNSAAEARMMQADGEYEKFLSIVVPTGLDFTEDTAAHKKRSEESKKKFKAYLDSKQKQLALAKKAYEEVILFKQANWAIAAAARVGQLYQDFAGQLFTAQVPKAPPGIDPQLFHDAYCDGLVDAAEPLEAKAVDGLSICLNKSTELSWFNEWSALCESELNQLKPSEYPIASEIRAQPGYSSVSLDKASVQPLEQN